VGKDAFLALILISVIALCSVVIQPVCASEDTWTIKASMTTADGAVGAVTVDGRIYVFDNLATEEYDPQTDTWTQRAPMPTPRHHFGIAVCQNKIYCIGGTLSSGSYTGINEVYDPATDSWETKTPMPTRRSQLDAHMVNDKIYLIGGRIGGNKTTVYINEVYDPVTDSWTQKSPSLYAVNSYVSAALDGKIYIIGGQSDFVYGTNLDIVQIYNVAADSWTLGKSAPSIIWQAGAAATTGIAAPKRIYVMGGMTGFSEGLDRNLVYDPEVDTWTSGTPLPNACFNPAVAVIDDILYVIGGAQYLDAYKTNAQYTPIGYGTIQPSPTATQSLSPTPTPVVSPSQSSSPSNSPSVSATDQQTITPQPQPETSQTDFVYIIVVVIILAVVIATALVMKRRV
jgi:N-acetylneuraminic acid mutarotase